MFNILISCSWAGQVYVAMAVRPCAATDATGYKWTPPAIQFKQSHRKPRDTHSRQAYCTKCCIFAKSGSFALNRIGGAKSNGRVVQEWRCMILIVTEPSEGHLKYVGEATDSPVNENKIQLHILFQNLRVLFVNIMSGFPCHTNVNRNVNSQQLSRGGPVKPPALVILLSEWNPGLCLRGKVVLFAELSTAAWLRRLTKGPEWRQCGDAVVNMASGFISSGE